MKNPAMMQLTVQVGRCSLPALPYSEYSLSVRLNKDLAAATSFKYADDGCVHFGTRLFLRAEKTILEATPQCSVSVTAISEKASRIEVARGEAKIGQEGRQQVRLAAGDGRDGRDGFLEAELEFCWSAWEVKQTKTNNIRTGNIKSHLSQKQSSCEQKQPHPGKTAASLHLDDPDDKKQKNCELSSKFSTIQVSRSEKILPDQSTELETSANTLQHTKTQENLNKSEDSEMVIGMQIKIDHLEERIQALQQELRANAERIEAVNVQYEQQKAKVAQLTHQQECDREKMKELARCAQLQKERSNQLAILYEQQRSHVAQLEQSKEQLSEMLVLEQQKNNISLRHIDKLTKLIDTLSTAAEGNEINPIEQRDEIIMLNEELENEIISKNIAINQMKLEIQQLKQKIILMESTKAKKAPVYDAQINQKTTITSTKVIETDKAKLEKKNSEKIIPTPRKSDVQLPSARPKDAKKPKEKQIVEKKDIKAEPTGSKKPAVPKNPRQMKSPTGGKAQNVVSPKGVKGKGKPLLKIQQKTTMQSEKKSQGESCMTSMVSLDMMSETNNLMIHSRSHEGELSKLQPS